MMRTIADVLFVHRAQPGKSVDEHDEENHGHDDGDLRHQADAEPDDEDRRQRDFWDAVKQSDVRIENIAEQFDAAEQKAQATPAMAPIT